MNIGKFDIGIGGGADRYKHNTAKLEADIYRLALLVMMILAVIIGGICNNNAAKPTAMIKKAVRKTLESSFVSSFEGNVSMDNRKLDTYRIRHRYHPANGLEVVSSTGTSREPQFDPVSALKLILQSGNPVEYSPEDMYARPTLRYAGSLRSSAEDSLHAYTFYCWIDMRKRVMVRLELSGVQRNAGVDENGEPVSKETFLNIRYSGYRE